MICAWKKQVMVEAKYQIIVKCNDWVNIFIKKGSEHTEPQLVSLVGYQVFTAIIKESF